MPDRVSDRGELALVLHSHMPYVEGFGTWPFGEEWLWEAMATCYLPLLDVLGSAPLTLSVTPVLADQLEAPGVGERFTRFLREVRRDSHARDIEGCRATGQEGYARELERAAGDYEGALERFEAIDGDLLGALAPHASWTSSATHAILPLLATHAGVRLQVQTGIAAHRRRTGAWGGGFWLPECAHVPWLDPLLVEAGVRASCVDLTDVFGIGSAAHLRPLRGEAGLTLVPLDRETIELVWSDRGYPAHGIYRDYHHHTTHHHRVWGNDGRPYDHEAALARARVDARDFVSRTLARLEAGAAELDRPALAVCALDTELLGHWWYEGLAWLSAVIDEAATQGLVLTTLDDALARLPPADPPPATLPVTTWGAPRDLSTWDGPQIADLVWQARAGELRLVGAPGRASAEAVRELLALQASDWAFQITRGLSGPYPRARAAGHARALDAALAGIDSGPPGVRNLAVDVDPAALLAP